MLVVDSPYPPYSPVEYVFRGVPDIKDLEDSWSDEPEVDIQKGVKAELLKPVGGSYAAWMVGGMESRGDGKASYIQWDTPFIKWKASPPTAGRKMELIRWKEADVTHRDGDLPAHVWLYNQDNAVDFTFYKKGQVHRVSCAAQISARGENEHEKSFYLYNQILTEKVFLQIHAIAIQYNIPMWLAYATRMFDINLGEVESFHNQYVNLANFPPEWIAKTLGMRFDERGSLVKTKGPLENYAPIYYVLPLIQYEKFYSGAGAKGF